MLHLANAARQQVALVPLYCSLLATSCVLPRRSVARVLCSCCCVKNRKAGEWWGRVSEVRPRQYATIRALPPRPPLLSESDEKIPEEEKKSRGQSKRESARAKDWAVQLVELSPAQLRQAIRWASLPEDLYDAVMLVKGLGTSSRVRIGRRRQINFIGGVLRDADPDLMESVLKAIDNGDVGQLMVSVPDKDDEEEEEESFDSNKEKNCDGKVIAEQWVDGLISGVPSIENEVYSLYDVEYDHQELQELICSAKKYQGKEPLHDATSEQKRLKSRKALLNFVTEIARQRGAGTLGT